jgi:hypothetical protein
MRSKRKRTRVKVDPLIDVDDWLTPEEFEGQFPKIATASAITRDVWNRKALGLEQAGVIRRVGKRCLIHRKRYVLYRLGELQL